MNRPWLAFYVQDWLSDPALQRCSLEAQGAWIKMICYMHKGEPYGHLRFGGEPLKEEEIRRLIGSDNDLTDPVSELFRHGVCSKNRDGIIYSRRMIRDEVKRKKDRKYQKNHRAKEDSCQADVSDLSGDCQEDVRPMSGGYSESQSYDKKEKDLSSESSKTQTLQKAGEGESVPSKRFSKPENSKGKSKTLSAGAAAWRGLKVSWADYRDGVSWSEETATVEIDGLAGGGLRQHLGEISKEEELPMLTDAQLQEGWGKMNSNFLADPRKRGKHLPSHVMKWLESDMRRLGSYSKGKAKTPDAFKVAMEKALLEESSNVNQS